MTASEVFPRKPLKPKLFTEPRMITETLYLADSRTSVKRTIEAGTKIGGWRFYTFNRQSIVYYSQESAERAWQENRIDWR